MGLSHGLPTTIRIAANSGRLPPGGLFAIQGSGVKKLKVNAVPVYQFHRNANHNNTEYLCFVYGIEGWIVKSTLDAVSFHYSIRHTLSAYLYRAKMTVRSSWPAARHRGEFAT